MSSLPITFTYGEEPIRFERLLNLSMPLTSLPSEQIDSMITATQKSLCDALGPHSGGLGLWDEAAKVFVVRCLMNDPPGRRVFTPEQIPWLSDKILSGQVIHFGRHSELPTEGAREIDSIARDPLECATFLPLKVQDRVLGFLCFGTIRPEIEWSKSFLGGLRAFADVVADAIERNRAVARIPKPRTPKDLEAYKQIQLAIDSVPIAVVLADDEGTIHLANIRTASTFGYQQEELLGRPIELLIPGSFREDHVARYADSAAPPIALPMGQGRDLRAVRKDGSEFQAEVALSSLHTDWGHLVLSAITDVSARSLSEKALIDVNLQLQEANEKIRDMKEQLKEEIVLHKQEIKFDTNHSEIVGQSQALLRVLRDAEKVAVTDSAVLLLGETGTGKELIARAIHRNSKRKNRTMVNVNCAALPASLVENELFGRERGAYTGALTREVGRFELADQSTIFLDEVGELPLELQSKLLRVLQEGEFERLGSSKTIHVNVRLIAATSRDLQAAVSEGKFREDLYYRLNVFPIRVPPLRERREDIPMIAWHFLKLLGDKMGRDVESVRATTMKALEEYHWPGNVRELRNVIERNLITEQGPVFEAELPQGMDSVSNTGTTIEKIEREHIIRLLERSGWRIRGPGGASQALGLRRTTLEARMKKLGIFRKA